MQNVWIQPDPDPNRIHRLWISPYLNEEISPWLIHTIFYKKFELMLTRRAKAYSSSDSVVTHRSTNRARCRVTLFQSKHVAKYATPPTSVLWRHLVNDIDLRSPKSLKSLTPACAGLHEPRGSGLRLLKSTFNAENFIRRLSWSNSSHFVAIQYWNVRSIQILRKIH